MSRTTSLRYSYSLIAPLYDRVVEKATTAMRKRSLQVLNELSPSPQTVLINGIGSGLDLPFLTPGPRYVGLDLTANMIKRARHRINKLHCDLQLGNAMQLPYRSASFDAVVLHLIVAVTPQPAATLAEAFRVVKPGGHVLVMDKFLRRGQLAPVRRLLSPLIGMLATQTNVVWEDIFQQAQQYQHGNTTHLTNISDQPDLGGGWFRRIVLQRDS